MNISIPGLLMICGLQGTGKSHLIKYLICKNREKFDVGLVFSSTGNYEGNFDYIDKRFVHRGYNEAKLRALMKILDEKNKVEKNLLSFVIFDDCLDSKQWRSPTLIELATTLRHRNIFLIISTQYPKAIPPVFRTNTFQAAMFHMDGEPAIRGLYEAYGQMMSFDDFKRLYIYYTSEPYHFIVYNLVNSGRTIPERYKQVSLPKEIPKFFIDPNARRRPSVC